MDNDQNWFAELATELDVDTDELTSQLIEFRKRTQNTILRSAYPTDVAIKNYKDTEDYYVYTSDFIMSFLDAKYRGVDTTFSSKERKKFRLAVKRKHKLALTRALDLENHRRSKYWKDKSEQLEDRFLGQYVLLRKTTRGDLATDILALRKNRSLRQIIDAYWLGKTEDGITLFAGNFYCGDSSLFGTFVRASSDRVFQPYQMIIGYNELVDPRDAVYTGLLSGTRVLEGEIFTYPFCILGWHELPGGTRLGEFRELGLKKIEEYEPDDRASALISQIMKYDPLEFGWSTFR